MKRLNRHKLVNELLCWNEPDLEPSGEALVRLVNHIDEDNYLSDREFQAKLIVYLVKNHGLPISLDSGLL